MADNIQYDRLGMSDITRALDRLNQNLTMMYAASTQQSGQQYFQGGVGYQGYSPKAPLNPYKPMISGLTGQAADAAIGGAVAMSGPLAPITGIVGSDVRAAIARQQMVQNVMGSTAYRWNTQFGQGGVPSQRDVQTVSSQLGQMGPGADLIFGKAQSMGLMGSSENVQQYMQRFKKVLDDTKKIAKVLQTTQEQAVNAIKEFSDMGFKSSQYVQVARQMEASGRAAGISPSEMIGIGRAGAGVARQFGVSGTWGAGAATSFATAYQHGVNTGAVSSEDLAAMGGLKQASLRSTARAQQFFRQGEGKALLAAMYAGGDGLMGSGGRLDMNTLADYISGKTNPHELMGKASRIMSRGKRGMMDWMANQGKMISQISPDMLPLIYSGAAAQRLRAGGMDVDETSVSFMLQRTMGFGEAEARSAAGMYFNPTYLEAKQKELRKTSDMRWAEAMTPRGTSWQTLLTQATSGDTEGAIKSIGKLGLRAVGLDTVSRDVVRFKERLDTTLSKGLGKITGAAYSGRRVDQLAKFGRDYAGSLATPDAAKLEEEMNLVGTTADIGRFGSAADALGFKNEMTSNFFGMSRRERVYNEQEKEASKEYASAHWRAREHRKTKEWFDNAKKQFGIKKDYWKTVEMYTKAMGRDKEFENMSYDERKTLAMAQVGALDKFSGDYDKAIQHMKPEVKKRIERARDVAKSVDEARSQVEKYGGKGIAETLGATSKDRAEYMKLAALVDEGRATDKEKLKFKSAVDTAARRRFVEMKRRTGEYKGEMDAESIDKFMQKKGMAGEFAYFQEEYTSKHLTSAQREAVAPELEKERAGLLAELQQKKAAAEKDLESRIEGGIFKGGTKRQVLTGITDPALRRQARQSMDRFFDQEGAYGKLAAIKAAIGSGDMTKATSLAETSGLNLTGEELKTLTSGLTDKDVTDAIKYEKLGQAVKLKGQGFFKEGVDHTSAAVAATLAEINPADSGMDFLNKIGSKKLEEVLNEAGISEDSRKKMLEDGRLTAEELKGEDIEEITKKALAVMKESADETSPDKGDVPKEDAGKYLEAADVTQSLKLITAVLEKMNDSWPEKEKK